MLASATVSPAIQSARPIHLEVVDLVKKRLAACPYARLRNIQCRYYEGVLTLTGEVSTYYAKQVAQEWIRHLKQVEKIDNCLRVSYN